MAPISTPDTQAVVSQDGALVGDEAVAAQTYKVEPQVNTESVPAQVAPEREAPAGTVPVHETVVHTDYVVTDPSSPEAVQVPDAGRGNASLPIHQLGEKTPEQVFAGDAPEVQEREGDVPTAADPNPDPNPDATTESESTES